MNTYTDGASSSRAILKWLIVGILAVVAINVGLAIAGVVTGVLFFALLTLGPILIVGWFVLKFLRHFAGKTDGSAT